MLQVGIMALQGSRICTWVVYSLVYFDGNYGENANSYVIKHINTVFLHFQKISGMIDLTIYYGSTYKMHKPVF